MPTRPAFVLRIFESEHNEIKNLVLQFENIETGGDLFGLWTKDNQPVVQFIIGPGKQCRRTSVSFHQDVNYLGNIGGFLNTSFMLCHIGSWHSHHQLNLTRPSHGDHTTVRNNFPAGLDRYIMIIANIKNHPRTVKLHPYMFSNDGVVCEDGQVEVIPYSSPFREMCQVADEIVKGAESKRGNSNYPRVQHRVEKSQLVQNQSYFQHAVQGSSTKSYESLKQHKVPETQGVEQQWYSSPEGKKKLAKIHEEILKMIKDENPCAKQNNIVWFTHQSVVTLEFLHCRRQWHIEFPDEENARILYSSQNSEKNSGSEPSLSGKVIGSIQRLCRCQRCELMINRRNENKNEHGTEEMEYDSWNELEEPMCVGGDGEPGPRSSTHVENETVNQGSRGDNDDARELAGRGYSDLWFQTIDEEVGADGDVSKHVHFHTGSEDEDNLGQTTRSYHEGIEQYPSFQESNETFGPQESSNIVDTKTQDASISSDSNPDLWPHTIDEQVGDVRTYVRSYNENPNKELREAEDETIDNDFGIREDDEDMRKYDNLGQTTRGYDEGVQQYPSSQEYNDTFEPQELSSKVDTKTQDADGNRPQHQTSLGTNGENTSDSETGSQQWYESDQGKEKLKLIHEHIVSNLKPISKVEFSRKQESQDLTMLFYHNHYKWTIEFPRLYDERDARINYTTEDSQNTGSSSDHVFSKDIVKDVQECCRCENCGQVEKYAEEITMSKVSTHSDKGLDSDLEKTTTTTTWKEIELQLYDGRDRENRPASPNTSQAESKESEVSLSPLNSSDDRKSRKRRMSDHPDTSWSSEPRSSTPVEIETVDEESRENNSDAREYRELASISSDSNPDIWPHTIDEEVGDVRKYIHSHNENPNRGLREAEDETINNEFGIREDDEDMRKYDNLEQTRTSYDEGVQQYPSSQECNDTFEAQESSDMVDTKTQNTDGNRPQHQTSLGTNGENTSDSEIGSHQWYKEVEQSYDGRDRQSRPASPDSSEAASKESEVSSSPLNSSYDRKSRKSRSTPHRKRYYSDSSCSPVSPCKWKGIRSKRRQRPRERKAERTTRTSTSQSIERRRRSSSVTEADAQLRLINYYSKPIIDAVKSFIRPSELPRSTPGTSLHFNHAKIDWVIAFHESFPRIPAKLYKKVDGSRSFCCDISHDDISRDDILRDVVLKLLKDECKCQRCVSVPIRKCQGRKSPYPNNVPSRKLLSSDD